MEKITKKEENIMNFIKSILVLFFVLSFILSAERSFCEGLESWTDVVESSSPVKIYVSDMINKSKDKNVDAGKVTQIVKQMFSDRISPKFEIVNDPKEADIIFKGVISDYVWSKKAPITDIYSPGAIALDQLTRDKKNWARMEVDYKVTAAGGDNMLLDYETQVTLKKPGIPKDKSYGIIYERFPKILSMDIFKRYKR